MASPPKNSELQVLNALVTCKICSGYFIDATTITECLHTFCRSCIVKHFKKSLFCPECEVQVERGCPLNKLRPDPRKQLLVYKIVPRLHENEVARQWNFLKTHQTNPGPRPILPGDLPEETIRDRIVDKIHVYSPDDKISLSVEYESESHIGVVNGGCPAEKHVNTHKRYLQCPAALTVYHLKKFIRLKYDFSNMHKITICYEGEQLPDDTSLMDVAYQFFYEAKSPMRFTYRVSAGIVLKATENFRSRTNRVPAKPVLPMAPVMPTPSAVASPSPSPSPSVQAAPAPAGTRPAARGSASSNTSSSDEGSTTSTRRQQRQRSAKTAAYTAIEAMDESDHEEEPPAKRRRTPGKSPRGEIDRYSPEPFTVYRNTRRTPRTSLEDFEARYNAKPGPRRVYAAFSDDELSASDSETKRNTLANANPLTKYGQFRNVVKTEADFSGRLKPMKNGKKPRSKKSDEDVYEFNSQNEDNEDSNTTQEFDFVYDNSDHESAGSDRRREAAGDGVADSTEGASIAENGSATVTDQELEQEIEQELEPEEMNDVDAEERELEQHIEMEVVTDTDDIDQHIEDSIEEVEVDADEENAESQAADEENDNQLEAETTSSSCLVIAEDEEDDGVVEEVIAAEEDGHELVVVEDPDESDVTYTVEVFNVDAQSSDKGESSADPSLSPDGSVSSKSPAVEEDEPEIVHEKVVRKKSKKSKHHHHHHHHHKRKRHHSPVMLISSPEEAPMKLTLKLRPTPSISPGGSSSKSSSKSPLAESPSKEKKVTFGISPSREGSGDKIYTVKITSPKLPSPAADSSERKFSLTSRDTGKNASPAAVPASPKVQTAEPLSPKVSSAPVNGNQLNTLPSASPKAASTYPRSPTPAPSDQKMEDSAAEKRPALEEVKDRLSHMRQVRVKLPATPAPSPPPTTSKTASSMPDLKSVKTPSSLTISKVEAGEAPPRAQEASKRPALEILMLPPSPPPSGSPSNDAEQVVASSEPAAKKRCSVEVTSAPSQLQKLQVKADSRQNAAEQPCVLDLSDKTKREASPKPQVSSTTPSPVPKSKPQSPPTPPREISVRNDLNIGPTAPELNLMTNPQLLTIQTLMNEATIATMNRMNGFLGASQILPKLPIISPFQTISAVNNHHQQQQPQRRILPTLNDIYASRRVSGFTMPTAPANRPGPNQTVRHIPNPSALLHRQQSLQSLQHTQDKLIQDTLNKQQGQLTEEQLKERYQQFQQNRAAKAAFTYSRANSVPAPNQKRPALSGGFPGGAMTPPASNSGSMPTVSTSSSSSNNSINNNNNNLVVKTAIRPRSIEKVAGLLSVRAGAYAVETQVGH